MKEFLFGEDAPHASGIDVAVILLLMVFLFSSTLSIAVMNIGYGAAAILWVGRRFARRESVLPGTPLDTLLLAYVAAALLSLIFSSNREQSLLYTYRRLSLLPVIYVVFDSITSTRLLKILFATLVTSMVAVALWSCRDLFLHLHEYLLFRRRSNEFQMYMTAGGMMMMGMLLLVPFAFHPKTPKKIRLLAIVSMVPVALNLVFTFTRSSWLGFLAGAIVIGALRARKMFLPLVAVVVAVVMVASPEMRERMASIFDPGHETNITRVQMWKTGIEIFKANPIVGVGDIGIEHVWAQYAPPEWEPWGHLHNNLLMWLVTLGVIGFTVIVALFVKIWTTTGRIEKQLHGNWFLGSLALGGLAVLAGFQVNGLFEWNFGDAEIIMVVWALVGMTLAAEKVAQRGGTRA